MLDGWGQSDAGPGNAITSAPAENFLGWQEEWPSTLLSASGKEVGLPVGIMGNSEVGHTTLGAGRLVRQTLSRINASIQEDSFARIAALRGAVEHARAGGGRLHLFGLVGSGGVHAMDEHYRQLLKLAQSMGLPGDRLHFHAVLDGRDTPPISAPGFLEELEGMLQEFGGKLVGLCGRYWAMDRDQRWERNQLWWDALVHARADTHADSWQSALAAARSREETDEFIKPILIGEPCPMQDGDSVFSFNFRADRVRQISRAFLEPEFSGFERGAVPKVFYTTMTSYQSNFSCPVAFPPEELHALFGEVVAAAGLQQFRCAETEKYAHVTFFFNGGREEVYEGEERVLVPSPKVATYDLKPEMSAPQVTAEVCSRLEQGEHDLYVINFANPDMVGHTGNQVAAEEAVRAVDGCLGLIVEQALQLGGTVAITADHGNTEQMRDPITDAVHTAHTLNPVPFVLIGEEFQGAQLRKTGILADVAPTLLQTMKLPVPAVMDGCTLLDG